MVTARAQHRSKGSKIEEVLFWSRVIGPDFLIFWSEQMKRLQFILSTLAATIVGLIASWSESSRLAEVPKLMTWAERMAEDKRRTRAKRYEHPLHANYCRGSLDHLSSAEEVASVRRDVQIFAACAGISTHSQFGRCRTIIGRRRAS